MGQQVKKTGAKGRKIGSNKVFCKAYKSFGTREKNQRRRMRRHLREPRHKNDVQGLKAFIALGGTETAIRT
jgi:hypothetical protein